MKDNKAIIEKFRQLSASGQQSLLTQLLILREGGISVLKEVQTQ
jgi:hypothetical protein